MRDTARFDTLPREIWMSTLPARSRVGFPARGHVAGIRETRRYRQRQCTSRECVAALASLTHVDDTLRSSARVQDPPRAAVARSRLFSGTHAGQGETSAGLNFTIFQAWSSRTRITPQSLALAWRGCSTHDDNLRYAPTTTCPGRTNRCSTAFS